MKIASVHTAHLIELLEARIAPAAILNVTDVSAKLPAVVVPGDSGSVTFTITNNGTDDFTGDSGIIIELSSDADPFGASIQVGHFENSTPSIKSGDSKTITKSFKIPPLVLPNPELPAGSVFVIVDVRASNDYGISEGHGYKFQFGQVGDRKVSLPAIDGDGTKVVFKLSGAGTGELQPAGGLVDMAFANVTKESGVKATGGGGTDGVIKLNDIGTASQMKGLVMPFVDADGNLVFTGGLELLQLNKIGSTSAHTVLNVGAGDNKPMKMTFTKVTEMDFNLGAPLDTLTIGEWDNTNATHDNLNAVYISKLVTGSKKAGLAGNFETNLNLSGADQNDLALRSAKIGGALSDSTWSILNGSVNEIVIGDSANQWLLDVPNGYVSDIFVKKDLTGEKLTAALTAQTFGEIKVAGRLDASIKATLANAKGIAIGKLSASQVTGITVDATAGGIDKVDVGEWTGGGKVETFYIEKLEADGAFVPTDGDFSPDLMITGPLPSGFGPAYSLTHVTINGTVTGGTWTLANGAVAIRVGNTSANWTLKSDTEPSDNIGKLQASGDLAGEVSAGYFDDIIVGGTLSAKVTAINSDIAVAKIVAGKINGAVIKGENAFIGSLKTGEWTGGSLQTKTIGSLVVTGSAKANLRGDIVGVNINLTGTYFPFVPSISVRGALTNVNITTAANSEVKLLHAGEWVGGTYTGGYIKKLDIGGVADASGNLQNVGINVTGNSGDFSIGDLLVKNSVIGTQIFTVGHIHKVDVGAMLTSGITVQGGHDINSFEINGIKGSITPAFDATTVSAERMFKVIVRDINEAAAAEYGLNANFISSYARFKGTAKVFTDVNLDNETVDAVPPAGTGYRVKVT